MAKTKYGDIKLTDNKYNNKIVPIVDELDNGTELRRIANTLKVPYGVVVTVHKKYKTLKRGIEKYSANNDTTEKEQTTPVEIVEPNIEEKCELTEEGKHVKYSGKITGKREKISDDIVLEILAMCDKGISKVNIAKEIGLAYSTVCRYAKEYGYGMSTRKNTKSKPRKKSKPKNKNNQIKQNQTPKDVVPSETSCDVKEQPSATITQYKENIIECGLIKDRHDMPVDKFIFDKVQESIMFKYDEQEKIVSDFIKREIKISRNETTGELYGDKTLVVYVTGLTCCLASVIKTASKYGVNLTLMHHNNRSNKYFKQVIWNEFGKGYINKLFPTATEIVLHDVTIDEMKASPFYVIRTVELHESVDNVVKFDIFKDQSQLWLYYGEILSTVMVDTSCRIVVYVDLSHVDNEKVVSLNKLSSVYNWSKDN